MSVIQVSGNFKRVCCAPDCEREITKSDGGIKAGDMLEFWEGTRAADEIRELCGLCALVYRWNEEGTLDRMPNN